VGMDQLHEPALHKTRIKKGKGEFGNKQTMYSWCPKIWYMNMSYEGF
jgi:hypothetical protein